MQHSDQSFAALLRGFRLRAGLSQAGLAARANLSVRAISDLERGLRRAPYLPTVNALGAALQLNEEEREQLSTSVPRGRRETPQGASVPPQPVLPPYTTSTFIARESELTRIVGMLSRSGVRLVTLTGPPGVGKTRLAIEVAQRLASTSGVKTVYVPLHLVRTPSQFRLALANALNLRPDNSPSMIIDVVASRIVDEPLLFMLDNFEQVMAASVDIIDLLRRCRRVQFLLTSRAPLLVRGEIEVPLSPLEVVPDNEAVDDPVRVAGYPAVALFVERFRAHVPTFEVTAENCETVAAISRRLDGIPLAIEIAAARGALLTPTEVLAGLSEPLQFLTGGLIDLPPHQQTVEGAISWSYQLLTPEQQRAFRWLSVLYSSWTMENAVELLATTDPVSPADRRALASDVSALVHHGLIEHFEERGATRLRMLNLISTFGVAQLSAKGELDAAGGRVVDIVTRLVEEVAPGLRGADTEAWMARIDQSSGIIRSALRHCLDGGFRDVGTELLWKLRYWFEGGPSDWGLRWIDEALSRPFSEDDGVTEAQLRILSAYQRWRFPRTPPAGPEVMRGLTLLAAEEWADMRQEALEFLQPLINSSMLPAVVEEADRQVERLRAAGNELGLARALMARSRRAIDGGRLQEAEADALASLAIAPEYLTIRRFAHLYLGVVKLRRSALVEARECLERGIQEFGGPINVRPVPYVLAVLGRISIRLGQTDRALREHAEAIERALAVGAMMSIPVTLDGIAWLAAAAHHEVEASRLLGAAEMPSYFNASHSLFDSLREREELIVRLRTQMGFHRFYSAYEEGRRLPPERAIAEALEEVGRRR